MYKKKQIFVLFIVLFIAESLLANDLNYKYIGDSTGIMHHYEVRMRIYFVPGSVPPTTMALNISSSCYPDLTIQLTEQFPSGKVSPTLFDCVDSGQGISSADLYTYKGYVELRGICADWIFSHRICCRAPTNNLVGQDEAYIEARLNNTLGENSSPFFVTEPIRAYCVGSSFQWQHRTIEPDGDSIHYRMINPLSAANTPIAFQPPYTSNQPFATTPPLSLVFDASTGHMQFTPGIRGDYAASVIAEEYRFDSVVSSWVVIGSSMRNLVVIVADSCSRDVRNGVSYDHEYAQPDPTANNLPILNQVCFDTIIELKFDMLVDCYSLAKNGTDFRLVSPTGVLQPVKALEFSCNVDNETDFVRLILHQPIHVDGDYYLYSKEGDDGNTVFNKCGFPMYEFDTLIVRIENCPQPAYDLKNVSVLENDPIELSWSCDSVPSEVIQGWYFYRSDDQGQTFNQVGSRVHENAGEDSVWIDYSVSHEDVNRQIFLYKLKMQIGGQLLPQTRAVTSIFLQKNEMNPSNWQLEWNAYNGWNDPEYHLMEWDIASDNWNLVPIPENPTFDTLISYSLPNEPGDYALRVDARDTAYRSVSYVSESNYIYFTVSEEKDELHIPNVFTPNGDGQNDVYEIEGLSRYQQVHIVITNRWGNKVFESEHYANSEPWSGMDQKSGTELPSGVYFYILRLYAGSEGDNVRTGQITLLR